MKTYANYLSIFFIAMLAIVACNSNKNSKQAQLLKLGIHTTVVQEAIQTSQYTYLRLTEIGNPKVKDSESLWVAVTRLETKNGDTLYYKGGFPMKGFKSKELNRTFEQILFLDSISNKTDFGKADQMVGNGHNYMSSGDSLSPGKPKIEKISVKIDPMAGVITIADLYAKKASFSGKTIKVKGQITKFSPEIMGKNWIHIQDGTESNGKFDLTITTDLTANVGDIVCFEGTIGLNKDLGFDYFYEVIMENAKIVK
jgi:hypothetical protein